MHNQEYQDLLKTACRMRFDIMKMAFNCGAHGAHIGGSLSAVDLLCVLYKRYLRLDPNDTTNGTRDRFVMSKAHSVMAQYAALHQIGVLSDAEMNCAMITSNILYKHPRMNIAKGIEFSGGSLGQGVSLAVGTAHALKLKGNFTSRVYTMLGDGECNEGSVWEAAAFATQYRLDNFTVLLDRNHLQNDGPTDQILHMDRIADLWRALDYDVQEIDGHNVNAIDIALTHAVQASRPSIIVADTVKGKGVSFAENVTQWHAGYVTQDLYDQAINDIGGSDDNI